MITDKLLNKEHSFRTDYMPYRLTEFQKEARRLFLEEIHYKGRYIQIDICPYCGTKDFTKISETNRRGLPSDVVICDFCDGCFKSTILNPEGSRYLYENLSYALRGKDTSHKAMEDLFLERVNSFAYERFRFISHFIKLLPREDLIAEFGCSDGANLFPWLRKGFAVLGIELDPKMIKFGQEKGINLVHGDFMNYTFQKRRPGLIILSHMLEHVSDVNAVLARLHDILQPDGYLFIEVPGIKVHGLVDTLRYFDIEHNYNFDLRSITGLLRKHRFKIIYADEYSRVLCTPNLAYEPSGASRVIVSAEKIGALIMKSVLAGMNFKKKNLQELLRKDSGGDPVIRIFNKAQSLYFRYYYQSIVKTEEKNAKI
ncbi:MAG: class I SAM-dependent methyltransferase [Candidatus Omnitrophota bacterium]